jgi:CRP-like cAMP-binding protein
MTYKNALLFKELSNKIHPLTLFDILKLAGYTKTIKFEKGQTIYDSRNDEPGFFFVIEGVVCHKLTDAKNEPIVWFTMPGELSNDIFKLYNYNNTKQHFVALTKVIVAQINYADYLKVVSKNSNWQKFHLHTTEYYFSKVTAFHYRLYEPDLRKRYELVLEYFPGIENYITNKEIASFLSIAPETLSRKLAE